MVSEERKTKKRGFIQYLYEERLKDEEIQARAKDMVTWSAEPGNAKASISVDRRRYETVCVPRSNPCCCFAVYPALQLARHRVTVVPDFDYTTVTPCHIPKSHEERRTEVRTNGIHQAFADPGMRRDRVMELGLSKHRIEAARA